MSEPFRNLTPKRRLLLILVPMLATFACQRSYLHIVGVRHVHAFGYLVHHLFFGVLIQVPAAFILAFGARSRWVGSAALVALGIGTGMILDEVTYLVATRATDADYISSLSLGGAIAFISLAVILLLTLYGLHREEK